jgi:hypothetical protein
MFTPQGMIVGLADGAAESCGHKEPVVLTMLSPCEIKEISGL